MILATAAVAGIAGGTFFAVAQVSGPAAGNAAEGAGDSAAQSVDADDRGTVDRAGRSHPLATANVGPPVGPVDGPAGGDAQGGSGSAAAGSAGSPSVLSGSAKPSSPAAKGTSPAPTGGPTEVVISLVNTERAKAGCPAVTSNAKLAGAALGHSQDMASRDYFSHDTPEGVSAAQRLTDSGYKWSTMGENIAYGQSSAQSVMTAWMNSSGHKANILNCAFKEIGVGLAYTSGRTPYWTQDFGSSR